MDATWRAAEKVREAGIHGVFAYDHLWPMGHPERPALAPFPVLGALAQRYDDLDIGPLVARVGLVETERLAANFGALSDIAPGRVIAALGTGDSLSRDENEAFGVPFDSAQRRRELLSDLIDRVSSRCEVWVGAGAPATNELARSHGVTLNFWNLFAHEARERSGGAAWNWAGNPRDDLMTQLDELRDEGARYAVFSPKVDIEVLKKWIQRDA